MDRIADGVHRLFDREFVAQEGFQVGKIVKRQRIVDQAGDHTLVHSVVNDVRPRDKHLRKLYVLKQRWLQNGGVEGGDADVADGRQRYGAVSILRQPFRRPTVQTRMSSARIPT